MLQSQRPRRPIQFGMPCERRRRVAEACPSLIDLGPLNLAEHGGRLADCVAAGVAKPLGPVRLAVEAVAGVLGKAGRGEQVGVGEEQALPRGAGRLEHRHIRKIQGGHDGKRDPGGRREKDGGNKHAVEDGKHRSTNHREEPCRKDRG